MTELAVNAGQVANYYASQQVFEEFRLRKSENTLRAHNSDLDTFNEYLDSAGMTGATSWQVAGSWGGVTWGLVAGFVRWMLDKGWAISSINRKLSTVKIYATLAAQAGVLASGELTLIKAVKGFSAKEVRRVDDKRTVTRKSTKKLTNTRLDFEQALALKRQPDTPQGYRDSLLMCLLLDMGFRAQEVADLTCAAVDLDNELITIYREKVQKQQTHRMTTDVFRALVNWQVFIDPNGMLLRSSNKSGALLGYGITTRAITARVRQLGLKIGIVGLSAHDCRHYWATRATVRGTNPFALMNAGGWNSITTVERYVDKASIANEGVIL